MFCPKCGKKLSDTARFCGCGHKFEKSGRQDWISAIKVVLGWCACWLILAILTPRAGVAPPSDWHYQIHDGRAEITGYDGKESEVIIPGEVEERGISCDVIEIGDWAFCDCSSLTSIEIPESVTEISSWAFSGCSSLTEIEIPEGVIEIGERAFLGCSSLTSIEIPGSVTKIGGWAFSGCSSLTSIEIPEGVVEIGYDAFEDCSSLTSIEIPDSVTNISLDAFPDGCEVIRK